MLVRYMKVKDQVIKMKNCNTQLTPGRKKSRRKNGNNAELKLKLCHVFITP